MRKLLVIASREYLAAVKTKAFLIGLVIMPVMMGGSALLQMLVGNVRDVKDKNFAIIDRTPGQKLLAELQKAVEQRNKDVVYTKTGKKINAAFEFRAEPPSAPTDEAIAEQRLQLSEQVRKGELFGFLDIGPDVLTAKSIAANSQGKPWVDVGDHSLVQYYSNRLTFTEFSEFVKKKIDAVVLERLASDVNGNPKAIKKVAQPVPVATRGLLKRDPVSGQIQDAPASSQAAAFLIPFILIMMMFMVIMSGATPLMQGIVEEKMQRIAEVLLGSVSPFQLMLGKLLGMTAVSLTMSGVYLTGAFWAAHHFGYAEYVAPGLLAWFLVFQCLAALMYGALFIAIGAACSDMKETQTLLLPVMLLACLPLFVIVNVIQEPNGPVATSLSFFPFATPMLMIARLAIPPGIPWWQPLAGVLLDLATTILCVWVAGRIFRVGILMQGKGARLGEMARWVLRG